MRKMCEITGERMDEPMEEVVRKLEEGWIRTHWRSEWELLGDDGLDEGLA